MARKSLQNMNQMSQDLGQKTKNASRKREKPQVERGVKRIYSLATVQRNQGFLWVLTISFFMVGASARILLCVLTWFWIHLCILPCSLSDLLVLREFKGKIIDVPLCEAN